MYASIVRALPDCTAVALSILHASLTPVSPHAHRPEDRHFTHWCHKTRKESFHHRAHGRDPCFWHLWRYRNRASTHVKIISRMYLCVGLLAHWTQLRTSCTSGGMAFSLQRFTYRFTRSLTARAVEWKNMHSSFHDLWWSAAFKQYFRALLDLKPTSLATVPVRWAKI